MLTQLQLYRLIKLEYSIKLRLTLRCTRCTGAPPDMATTWHADKPAKQNLMNKFLFHPSTIKSITINGRSYVMEFSTMTHHRQYMGYHD
ncbi:hypothetical protein LINGRAHAP2_LOCUS26351 [Linum grandiflorum]